MKRIEDTVPNHFLILGTGVVLFLFIPLVLFLFVRHPAPVGVSLGVGVLLIVGHRLLARPYMAWVAPVKCVWCNRVLVSAPEGKRAGEVSVLELQSGGGVVAARCCAVHRRPATKFFTFLHAWRWPLRLGIFVPLLFLLTSLAAAAAGQPAPVELATAWFKLVVGLTVNLAALGYFFSREDSRLDVPFPVHNFFLLGVRILLWIFRLVGLWWIWQGLAYVLKQ
ncbi:MAG TPA: hypothetical protein VGS07_15125 [Thermoanaerobaculia bacterium]|jgi:hypothetical protein|nr:hypothetical protein [Thermoanaerobaculia bacterium]